MKYCPKCGSELPEDALFCGSCGARQAGNDNMKKSGSDNSKTKKIIIFIAAVIVLIVATVIIVVVVSKGKEKERERERTAQLLAYKADDVTSAGTVATSVNMAMANEAAYDDLMMNNLLDNPSEIVAVALSGEPFKAYGGHSLDNFIKELNREGTSPVLKYTESVNGWTPAGWAISINKDRPVVYITDGTTAHMIEVYPTVSMEYQ